MHTLTSSASTIGSRRPAVSDPLRHRISSELAVFTTWLEQHRVGGYIGEVGWPHDEDASRWNAVAESWFKAADAADLWVTAWATGESWRSDYPLALYEARGDGILDTPAEQAVVLERHLGSERCPRGYQWSSVGHWAKWNPRPWISDPAGNFLYEAHHYFDRDNSGRYVHSYEEEVEDAAARGY